METFSFNPPINLVEESKWLRAVSLFDATNSVFNITSKNNSFSITIPGYWQTKSDEKTIGELNKLLELKSQKSIEGHVKELRKRRHQIEIRDDENNLSDFDTQKMRSLKN